MVNTPSEHIYVLVTL